MHVEVTEELFNGWMDDLRAFERQVSEKLRSVLLVRPKVRLVEPARWSAPPARPSASSTTGRAEAGAAASIWLRGRRFGCATPPAIGRPARCQRSATSRVSAASDRSVLGSSLTAARHGRRGVSAAAGERRAMDRTLFRVHPSPLRRPSPLRPLSWPARSQQPCSPRRLDLGERQAADRERGRSLAPCRGHRSYLVPASLGPSVDQALGCPAEGSGIDRP